MRGTIDFTAPHELPVPIGDENGAETIAAWFGSDIQYSTSSVDRWLTTFSEISTGKANGGYQGTGNVFSVFATGSMVFLASEHIESHKVCLNVEQVSAALEQYRRFLTSHYKSPGFQPTPFGVEFLADKDQACECYLEHGGVMA